MLTVERGRSREKIKNYFSRSLVRFAFVFSNNNNLTTTTTAAATFPSLCTNVDLLLCTLLMSFPPTALPPLSLSVGIVSMLMPAAVSIAGIAARAGADSSIQLLPLPPFALSCFCHLKTLHSAHGLHNEWNVSSFYSAPSPSRSLSLSLSGLVSA